MDYPNHQAVDIWLIPSSVLSSFSQVNNIFPSKEELICARRYTDRQKTYRYLQSRSAIRFLLASYLQKSPENLIFKYGEHGKPALANCGGLEFNVSHSYEFIIVAIGNNIRVGVDIEYVRPNPRDELADRILGSTASAQYKILSAQERSASFSIAWTEREALAKMLGYGIGEGWSNIISIFNSYDLVISPYFGKIREINKYFIHYLNLSSYALSLCVSDELSAVNVNYLFNFQSRHNSKPSYARLNFPRKS
nr:4'-phosphopantetheinyl transferase superfamily protein [uncultured Limnohabitans sp.]